MEEHHEEEEHHLWEGLRLWLEVGVEALKLGLLEWIGVAKS